MKGHMEKGKFHPHTEYKKGVRKSRDQSVKTQGVKRKARCIQCKEYKSTLEMGSPSNVCLGCMKRSGSTGFCPVCNYKITRDSEQEVNQHIKDHIQMQEHREHRKQGITCDCGVRKAREPDEGWQGRALSIPQLKKMLDAQNPESSSTNAEDAIKQYYTGSATHQHARSSHPDYPNYCHHCGLNLGVN